MEQAQHGIKASRLAISWTMLLKKTSRWGLPASIEVMAVVIECTRHAVTMQNEIECKRHAVTMQNGVLQQSAGSKTMPAEADLELGIAQHGWRHNLVADSHHTKQPSAAGATSSALHYGGPGSRNVSIARHPVPLCRSRLPRGRSTRQLRASRTLGCTPTCCGACTTR